MFINIYICLYIYCIHIIHAYDCTVKHSHKILLTSHMYIYIYLLSMYTYSAGFPSKESGGANPTQRNKFNYIYI